MLQYMVKKMAHLPDTDEVPTDAYAISVAHPHHLRGTHMRTDFHMIPRSTAPPNPLFPRSPSCQISRSINLPGRRLRKLRIPCARPPLLSLFSYSPPLHFSALSPCSVFRSAHFLSSCSFFRSAPRIFPFWFGWESDRWSGGKWRSFVGLRGIRLCDYRSFGLD